MAKTANWDSYLCLSLCFIAIELSGVHTEQSCYGSVSSTKLTCTGCPLDLPGPPPVPPTIGGSANTTAEPPALVNTTRITSVTPSTTANTTSTPAPFATTTLAINATNSTILSTSASAVNFTTEPFATTAFANATSVHTTATTTIESMTTATVTVKPPVTTATANVATSEPTKLTEIASVSEAATATQELFQTASTTFVPTAPVATTLDPLAPTAIENATLDPLATTAAANATIEPINATHPSIATEEPFVPGNGTEVQQPSPGGCNALCIALICAALILAAVGITCAIVLYGKKKRKWCWKEKSSKGGRTFYPKRGDVGAASSVEMGAANPALTNGESPTHKASPGHSDPGSPTRKRHHKKKHTRSHSPSPAHSGKVGPATETDGVSKSTDPLFDPDAKYVYPGTPPRDLPPVNTEENDESPRRKKKKKRKHKKKAEIAGDEEETGQPTLVSVNPKHMKSTAQSSVEPLPPVNVTAPPSALSPLKNPRPLPLPPLGTSDGHA